jgi:hypothetical protein
VVPHATVSKAANGASAISASRVVRITIPFVSRAISHRDNTKEPALATGT